MEKSGKEKSQRQKRTEPMEVDEEKGGSDDGQAQTGSCCSHSSADLLCRGSDAQMRSVATPPTSTASLVFKLRGNELVSTVYLINIFENEEGKEKIRK